MLHFSLVANNWNFDMDVFTFWGPEGGEPLFFQSNSEEGLKI